MSISVQVRGVDAAKKKLEELKENFTKPIPYLDELEPGVAIPVSNMRIEWNRNLKPEEGYANMVSTSTCSFSFDVKMSSSEDFIKAMGEFAPGKPLVISGTSTNVEQPEPKFRWVVDDLMPGNSFYVMASGRPRAHVESDIEPPPANHEPCLALAGDFAQEEYRGIYTRSNTSGVMLSRCEFQSTGNHDDEEGHVVRIRIGGGEEMATSNQFLDRYQPGIKTINRKPFPAIETIMKDIKKMKKKYDDWVTFEEKTGHWNKTIVKAMSGDKMALKKMQDLDQRSVCIMGKAWDGRDIWGPRDEKGNQQRCSACEELGHSLLRMFTRPEGMDDRGMVAPGGYYYYPTVMERYEEYKLMFEWHWNNSHAGHEEFTCKPLSK